MDNQDAKREIEKLKNNNEDLEKVNEQMNGFINDVVERQNESVKDLYEDEIRRLKSQLNDMKKRVQTSSLKEDQAELDKAVAENTAKLTKRQLELLRTSETLLRKDVSDMKIEKSKDKGQINELQKQRDQMELECQGHRAELEKLSDLNISLHTEIDRYQKLLDRGRKSIDRDEPVGELSVWRAVTSHRGNIRQLWCEISKFRYDILCAAAMICTQEDVWLYNSTNDLSTVIKGVLEVALLVCRGILAKSCLAAYNCKERADAGIRARRLIAAMTFVSGIPRLSTVISHRISLSESMSEL